MSAAYRMLEILALLVSLHNPDCWSEIEILYTLLIICIQLIYTLLYLLKHVLIPVPPPPPPPQFFL